MSGPPPIYILPPGLAAAHPVRPPPRNRPLIGIPGGVMQIFNINTLPRPGQEPPIDIRDPPQHVLDLPHYRSFRNPKMAWQATQLYVQTIDHWTGTGCYDFIQSFNKPGAIMTKHKTFVANLAPTLAMFVGLDGWDRKIPETCQTLVELKSERTRSWDESHKFIYWVVQNYPNVAYGGLDGGIANTFNSIQELNVASHLSSFGRKKQHGIQSYAGIQQKAANNGLDAGSWPNRCHKGNLLNHAVVAHQITSKCDINKYASDKRDITSAESITLGMCPVLYDVEHNNDINNKGTSSRRARQRTR